MKNWELEHQQRIAANQKKVEAIYQHATHEASLIGASISHFNPDKPFSFDDYPGTKYRIDKLQTIMSKQIQAVVAKGTELEWKAANKKNDELVVQILGLDKPTMGGLFATLDEEKKKKYFNNNADALAAFQQRKVGGLGLSERIWKHTDQFKKEIEMGLDDGIRNGRSAAEMARELRKNLIEPDRVYKRFVMNLKDSTGKDVLDSNGNKIQIKQLRRRYIDPITGAETWKVEKPKYAPGRGVYRSSLKNAQRLTRTENNMAYRASDHARIQQLDFVVGVEIKLSNAHKVYDICDVLKGKYPKEFKYTGWHPHCFCPMTFILKTPEELAEDTTKILAGLPTDTQSKNLVSKVPENFTGWVADNADRIKASIAKPYFIADNYIAGDIESGLKIASKKTPAELKADAEQAAKLAAAQKEAEMFAKINLQSDFDYTDAVKDPEYKKELEDIVGSDSFNQMDYKFNYWSKPQNSKPNTYYRVEGADSAQHTGIGKGLYLGKDKNAIQTFYDFDNKGLPVSEFTGEPKWLNLMDPKNRKAFEDYVAHKGIAIDSPEFSQLVKDMGFDGIRYFDTYATGEEFVLFDTTKLVKYDAAEQAAAEKAAITAEKTAYYQGLAAKKIKEAEKLGVTGPEMDELKAVIGDSKYTYSQIKGKIDKLNPVTNAAKAAQKTIDPLSDQALLKQFTQEEVDKLHEAHATFLNKISWMDLDGQITKVDFEINWLLKNGKYSTSSTLSKMLEKDLAALQVQKKYEATKNGAQTMVSLYKSKGDASLTASIKKLEAKLAKNVPIAELEQAIDDASLAVQSYNSKVAIAQATANAKAAAKQATANAKKAAGMNTAATEDITFYEDETDPFSLTKFYTPAEKAEVQRLRLELQNAIVKDNGSIRTWKVRDASDELTKKLEELGTKYHTKQKSWQHIGIETKGGVSKAVKLTDSQAKSAYDKYTGLPSTGKNYFNHGGPIGGKFVGEQDVMDRTKRYVERINQAGGKINETMVGVPGRYCRGSGFINNYILGHDTKPPSDVMAALDSYTGALSHALNMMPRYNGVTYRGSSYVDSMWKDIMEAQKNGKPFTNIAVMSTATEVSRADSFEKAITFKIYGRSGVRVDDFSHFKGEKEVLFRPGTKFEIIDVYKAKGDNDIANDGQWTVIMREILE